MSDERKTAEQPNNEILINAAHIAGEFLPAGVSRADLAKRIVKLATSYAAERVAEERAEGLVACCKDICTGCHLGWPLSIQGDSYLHRRPTGSVVGCSAAAIRKRGSR